MPRKYALDLQTPLLPLRIFILASSIGHTTLIAVSKLGAAVSLWKRYTVVLA